MGNSCVVRLETSEQFAELVREYGSAYSEYAKTIVDNHCLFSDLVECGTEAFLTEMGVVAK